MIFKIKITLILLLIGSIDVFAQLQDFKNFNKDQGLNQNYIYHISQNHQGFLCLSTSEGFVMYGGNEFKTFTNTNGLAEDFVNTHCTTTDSTIYFGHYQEGISYLKDFQFHTIANTKLKNFKINQILELSDKRILVATQGAGLWMIKNYELFKLKHSKMKLSKI